MPTSNSLKELIGQKCLIADGAMGTQLISRGYQISSCLALLNINNPTLIQDIHVGYIQAGSQIIFTHTFSANLYQLTNFKEEKHFKKINQMAVANAKISSSTDTFVAGSIGPSGRHENDINLKQFENNYAEQAKILLGEGVDMLALETITQFWEMKAITSSLINIKPSNVPLCVSVSLNESGELQDKTPLKTWLTYLNQAHIDIIGINCVAASHNLTSLLQSIYPQTKHPLGIKPNAGLPKKVGPNWIYPIDSDEFCVQMKEIANNEIAFIGGCCGTTPDYISKLKQYVRSAKRY